MPFTKEKNNHTLQRDITLLKSFMIGIAGKDKEGAYKKEFVERILRVSEEVPAFQFKDARSFLNHL